MPSAEPDLLRAVLAAPQADEPRRAYADGLAQSSRPADQARAEFIHLQLDLAKQSGDSPSWAVRVRPRAGVARPVAGRLGEAAARPVPAAAGVPGPVAQVAPVRLGGLWGFRRGFIEHVLAPAPTFLSEDVAILAHAPVRRVVLAHATEYVGPLAAESRLDDLDSLHLVGDMEMDEDLARLPRRRGRSD